MPFTISLTQGYTFSTDGTDKVTYSKLNQLGTPVTSLSGTINEADIDANAVTTSKIKDDAVTGPKIVDGAIGLSHLLAADQGTFLHHGEAGWELLPPGTDGQVLTTKGAAADAIWSVVPSVTTVDPTNISPGASGDVLKTASTGLVEWGTVTGSTTTSVVTPHYLNLNFSSSSAATATGTSSPGTPTDKTGADTAHYDATYWGVMDGNLIGGQNTQTGITALETAWASYKYSDETITDASILAMNPQISTLSEISYVGALVEIKTGESTWAGLFQKVNGKYFPLVKSFSQRSKYNSNGDSFHSTFIQIPVIDGTIDLRLAAQESSYSFDIAVGFKILSTTS